MAYYKFLIPLITIALISCSSHQSAEKSLTILDGLQKYEDGDIQQAKLLLKKSCDSNDRTACGLLNRITIDEESFDESFLYAKKACDLGNLRKCTFVGDSFLRMNNKIEARSALVKSGKINQASQLLFVELLIKENNLSEAKKLAIELCNDHYPEGCIQRASIAYHENDLKTAKKYYSMTEAFDNDSSFLLAVVDFRLGNKKLAAKRILEECAQSGAFACRIKKVLDLIANPPSFEKVYTSKCNQSDAKACYSLGLNFLLKNKIEVSAKLFEKACGLGDGNGCIEKYNATFITSSYESSMKILKDSCNKGTGIACVLLYDYRFTNDKTISSDVLEKGCNFGDGGSCYQMANVLWTQDNKDKALLMFEKSCKLNFQKGCFYFNFLGKVDEIKEAASIKYCFSNIDSACVELGELYANQNKLQLAQQFYNHSCELKNLRSCEVAIELKSRTDENFNKYMPHKDLCYKGHANSCMLAAEFIKLGNFTKEAIELFDRGCFLNNMKSCEYLGWIYSEEKDDVKAKYFYREACDMGSIYSCKELIKF